MDSELGEKKKEERKDQSPIFSRISKPDTKRLNEVVSRFHGRSDGLVGQEPSSARWAEDWE